MMQTLFQFIKKYHLPIFSGFLIGTSYIPFPPWAILFCYSPLLIFLTRDHVCPKKAFWGGWITQFILSLIGFHWIAYTAHEYGSFPWSLSVITLLLFAALIHLYIPLAAVLIALLRKKFKFSEGTTLFVGALTLSLLERAWPSIFPWNMAYSLLWQKLPAYQWADVIGFLGLSTLLFLLNALVAMSFTRPKQTKWPAVLAVILFVVLNISGMGRSALWQKTDSEINFLAVQANIGNAEKIQAEKGRAFQEFIIQKFLTDSKSGLEKYPESEILIWPETAIPYYMDSNFYEHRYPKMMQQGLSALNKPLLSGAYSRDISIRDIDRSVFNAFFLLNEQAQAISPPYRKTYLLAFGEYLPFSETFPILLKWLPFIANFGRGQGPEVLTWQRSPDNKVQFGAQICYEGLYPEFSRDLSSRGAEILANVTNDSWFGATFEPRQHMMMTFGRAIETRRPLIRSTNTGITSAILADGKILDQSPTHQTWFGLFKIKYLKSPPQTFYVLFGHWDWVLWVLLLLALILRGAFHARSSKS